MAKRLTVLDGHGPGHEPDGADEWILRLTGTDEAATGLRAEVIEAADAAAARVRAEFPRFLWSWVRDQRVLELADFDGVSWWWYTPLSEKSPLRSPLINELYRLTLLRELLARERFEEVHWCGDDAAVIACAQAVTEGRGVRFRASLKPRRRRMGLGMLAGRRALYLAYTVLRWSILRALRFPRAAPVGTDAVLYTRFPILWQQSGSSWHERMFGRWPDYLRSRGEHVLSAGIVSAGPAELLLRGRRLREICRSQQIVLFEALVGLGDVVRANLTIALGFRYLRWRAARRRQSVAYDGLEIGELLWRELDASAFSTEIPLDVLLARAFRTLIERLPSAKRVFLPFEYQPMERAVCAGAKAGRAVDVVGVQTAIYTANQMGFTFLAEELRVRPEAAGDLRAPFPDFVAAYGELPYDVFAARLGSRRVCLSGPIRYASFADADDQAVNEATARVPPGATLMLTPTPINRQEAVPMLRACFDVATDRPDLFLLVKFHYHLTLADEIKRLAAERRFDRFDVVTADLPPLMRIASMTVCAGSSVGVEALACGSMPLVYRTVGILSANPLLDVPEAAFFWSSTDELRAAIDACEREDEQYQARVGARESALRAQMFPLNGGAEERLYSFLQPAKRS